MKNAFHISKQIVCMHHLMQNIIHRLQDKVGLEKKQRNILISKIKQLSSADNSLLGDDVTTDIEEWCAEHAPAFLPHFKSRVLPLIHLNQLGTDDPAWTNNNCESANHLLKILTQWRQKSLHDLIDLLYDQIQVQYKDLERAITGRGDYQLQDKTYYCKPETWMTKKADECHKTLYKLLKDTHYLRH